MFFDVSIKQPKPKVLGWKCVQSSFASSMFWTFVAIQFTILHTSIFNQLKKLWTFLTEQRTNHTKRTSFKFFFLIKFDCEFFIISLFFTSFCWTMRIYDLSQMEHLLNISILTIHQSEKNTFLYISPFFDYFFLVSSFPSWTKI